MMIATFTLAMVATGVTGEGGSAPAMACTIDVPPIWPRQFRLLQNKTAIGASADPPHEVTTYYDFVFGANLILDGTLHDLELNDRRSYYWHDGDDENCTKIKMPVGILRPDWLRSNVSSLGVSTVNGRKVFGYTKDDFIDYYADVDTCEPVRWTFHAMKMRFDTIAFEPNVTVPSLEWFEPPSFCA